MAVELLARVHAEIEERLADLRPAVAEYERLAGATDALDADSVEGGEPPKSAAPAAAATRAKGAKGARESKGASGRPAVARAPRTPDAPRTPAVRRAKRGKQPRKAGKSAGAAEQAIVAALEHGSHTVAELVLVSALPGTDIRAGLRPLLKSGTVTRARRDGRAAYALSSAA
jgi:hypothetical protein